LPKISSLHSINWNEQNFRHWGRELSDLSWMCFMKITFYRNMINIYRVPRELTFISSLFILSDEHHWPYNTVFCLQIEGIKRKLHLTGWNLKNSCSAWFYKPLVLYQVEVVKAYQNFLENILKVQFPFPHSLW
jgi:hypothetical protein